MRKARVILVKGILTERCINIKKIIQFYQKLNSKQA